MCKNIDIDKLMAAGQVLKDDTATTVVRTSWMGRDVVVKRYNYRGFLRAIAGIFRRSRAKRAWVYGQMLKRLGIPTPEPLAYFETKKFGIVRESYLVTPYIAATNFYFYIRDSNLAGERKRSVVERIKGIMDALRQHKISHGDSKPSNFLVSAEGPVLTDLDSMRIHWSSGVAKKKNAYDISHFLLNINTDDISDETKQICADAMGHIGPLPYHYTSNYFTMPATPTSDWSLLIRRRFNSQDAIEIVDGGICLDDKRYTEIISSKMTRVWTTTALYRGKTINIYIKLHLKRSIGDFVKNLFRSGRGRRAFKASLMLRKNGFYCPEPLALLENRSGLSFTESILVTEGIAECVKLYTHFQRLASEGTDLAELEKKAILRQFGEYVGKMHGAGIFHGDLRTGNILLQNGPSASPGTGSNQWRFYLVDNERTRQFTAVPRRLVIKNLVQLNMFQTGISKTDRMRFLKAYNTQVKLSRAEIRRLCRQIIKKTNKRLIIRGQHHPS